VSAARTGVRNIDEKDETDPIIENVKTMERAAAALPTRGAAAASKILQNNARPAPINDPETQATLIALHPVREGAEEPLKLSSEAEEAIAAYVSPQWTARDITDYTAGRVGRATGPGGVSYDIFTASFSHCTTEQQDDVTRLIQLVAEGGLPAKWAAVHAALTNARGIALTKPGKPGAAASKMRIRPISIMDVIILVAHGVLNQKMMAVAKKYTDHNFAVGVSDGSAAYAHVITAVMAAKPDWLFLKLDIGDGLGPVRTGGQQVAARRRRRIWNPALTGCCGTT
jgi:hypothetical protein